MARMNKLDNVVAIDGPAGSGKSTVARQVAARLEFQFVDTGAMYRALTLKVIKAGVPLENENLIKKVTSTSEIELRGTEVFLDGIDVTEQIRSGKVTKHVARISAYQGVRSTLLSLQRNFAKEDEGLVMEGRDIGTVVFPQARWKYFLNASPEVRARRRHAELLAAGRQKELDWVRKDIEERDKLDVERAIAPLRAAEDAKRIDTSTLGIDEVTDLIVKSVKDSRAYAELSS